MILKPVPNDGHEFTRDKIDQRDQRKAVIQNFETCFGTIFTISVFKEASRNFILIFLLNKTG